MRTQNILTKAAVVGFAVVFFCGLAYVIVVATRLRTKAVEFTADTAAAFAKWGFATEYLIQVPQGAKNIKAIAYPGSNLYNVDYEVSARAFVRLGDSLGVSITPINASVRAKPFYRGGQWRKVRKGFCLVLREDELPSGVMVDVWYDTELSAVLYRQVGAIRGRAVRSHQGVRGQGGTFNKRGESGQALRNED